MRIGTWNLEGRGSDRHRDLLTAMDCDVLLLTEVPERFEPGSMAGGRHVLAAVERLSLQVPTASSPHRIEGLVSIDHIAMPDSWAVREVSRRRASVGSGRLSDHDAYVVEADRAPSTGAGEQLDLEQVFE